MTCSAVTGEHLAWLGFVFGCTESTLGRNKSRPQPAGRSSQHKYPTVGPVKMARGRIAAILAVACARFNVDIMSPLDNVTVVLVAGSFTWRAQKCTVSDYSPGAMHFLANFSAHGRLQRPVRIIWITCYSGQK